MKAIIIVVIILVVILLLSYNLNSIFVNYLNGVWVGDSEFLKKSDLSVLILYLDNNTGYLTMSKTNGDIIHNDKINFEISNKLSLAPLFGSIKKEAVITFEETLPFPSTLNYTLSIHDGSLILSDDDGIYAHLRRDAIASNLPVDD
jgi:hypothetical protein